MISPKLTNMPLVMRKFVRALNMFPSSAALGQINMIKVSKIGTKLELKLF
jgi:hypothetical protein